VENHTNEQDSPYWGELEDQQLTDDAVPICLQCLQPCNPLDYYCTNCGSNEPITPLASYMPYVDLRFRFGMIGKLWRTTWHRDTSMVMRVLYICLFMVTMWAFLLIGLPFVIYEMSKERAREEAVLHEDGLE